MAQYGPYYGDTMTISMQTSGGSTITIGSTQSVEIQIESEETEYFSADSTLREAVRRSEVVPVVTFAIGSWDIELHQQWISGGDSTTAGTSLSTDGDTSVPQKYSLTGSVSPVDDTSQAWEVTVSGVTIPTLPFFSASRTEFLEEEFEGRGDDLTIDQAPDPSVTL